MRFYFAGFGLRFNRKRLVGYVTTVLLVPVLWIAVPSLAASAAQYFHVFDKLIVYTYEITEAANLHLIDKPTGLSVSASGRGSDVALFEENFPDNWLVGIGSFNAANESTDEFVSLTNTYITFPVELGILGVACLLVALGFHYSVLLRNRNAKSPDFLSLSVTFLVMIAGIRCFAFHELWYAQANTLRLREDRLPTGETGPGKQSGAGIITRCHESCSEFTVLDSEPCGRYSDLRGVFDPRPGRP